MKLFLLLLAILYSVLSFAQSYTSRPSRREIDTFNLYRRSKDVQSQYHQAWVYIDEGDYVTAKAYLELAASKHYPPAVDELGYFYEHGYSVKKDYKIAMMYYSEAVDSGYSYAQVNVGYMYDHGLGVTEDKAVARKWYEKAAAQNNPNGLNNIGVFYEFGSGGLPQNDTVAFQYYKKASELGCDFSYFLGGRMYEEGRGGVMMDKEMARKWYAIAAGKNVVYGLYEMGRFYQKGIGGLPHNDSIAMQYFLEASELGCDEADDVIGGIFEYGTGVPVDDVAAVKYYQKTAEHDDALGLFKMGWFYAHGQGGLPHNDTLAMKYLLKSANLDNDQAQLGLGFMYSLGMGVPVDYEEGQKWYEKAAKHNNSQAISNIAVNYENGRGGLPENDTIAVQYYKRAADLGDAIAQNALGAMYQKGIGGLQKDTEAALKWYDMAAQQHNADALNGYAWLCYLKKINISKAIEYIKEDILISPDDYNLLDTYASLLFVCCEYQEAEKNEKKSLDHGGDKYGDYVERYGDILYKLNEKQDALKYWKMAKQLEGYSDLLPLKIAQGKYIE